MINFAGFGSSRMLSKPNGSAWDAGNELVFNDITIKLQEHSDPGLCIPQDHDTVDRKQICSAKTYTWPYKE